jgi:hypothetical protein
LKHRACPCRVIREENLINRKQEIHMTKGGITSEEVIAVAHLLNAVLDLVHHLTHLISVKFRCARVGEIALLVMPVGHFVGQTLNHGRRATVLRIPRQAAIKVHALDQHPVRVQFKLGQLDLSAQSRVIDEDLGADDNKFAHFIQDEGLDDRA